MTPDDLADGPFTPVPMEQAFGLPAPTRLSRFRMRPCPECGQQMRCRPGCVEGKAMLTWRCLQHGYFTDDEVSA